ncbi:mediator complex, subunit Med20 [Lipomyces japonicus]|uniref:mediator complex, subunit Med20 n=1 Tax=Lipomyces japonicus TaxID=56871 RepID=UPI0034CEC9DC
MPLTAVFIVQDSYANATTISKITDKVSRLFPKPLGKWSLEYKLYRENPALEGIGRQPGAQASSAPRYLSQLSLSHHEHDLFCLIDEPISNAKNGNAGPNKKKIMAVFDRGMDAIVGSKLQSLWVLRQSMRADGMAYQVGDDFVIRLGSVTQAGAFKFILLEVAYLPGHDLDQAKPIIEDFLQSAELSSGKYYYGDTIDCNISKSSLDPKVLKAYTGLQYMEAFRTRPN